MKTSIVAITGVATEIPAQIPSKYVRIKEDASIPTKGLIVNFKQSDHTYSSDVHFGPGEVIRAQGYSGIIARPAGYSAYLQPATAEALMKIRTGDASSINVIVEEFENTPPGDA